MGAADKEEEKQRQGTRSRRVLESGASSDEPVEPGDRRTGGRDDL